ncbi:MAG TPA: biopolymer transporter ExbD [Pirellulaceae bacterium]|nr:biopolymer transporter ExbD [Pirellulaceae bacterium]
MAVQLKRSSALAAISITPLIDVVFLLLIFFLVASRISDEENRLELDLPSVSQALPAMFPPDEVVINIDREGRYFINGEFRQVEQVEQILRRAQTQNPLTQAVLIRADKATDWEFVALAFDLCKKVGIHRYSATMEPD